jgi:molecular chaperone DnaJ
MPVTKRDYYEILGVPREADDQAVKGAYRKLAMKYHPDRNPGDQAAEDKFKEAAEAYSVLSDGQKRASYDRFGHQGVANAGGGFNPDAFADFSDILNGFFGFEDLFGGGGRRGNSSAGRSRQQRGEDLRYDLEITLEDCIRGMDARIRVPRLEACGRCQGSGAEKEDGLTTCPMCRGKGEVLYQQSFLSIRRTCSQCNGRGQIVRRPCKECKGEGYRPVESERTVTIPAGVDNGTRMRVTGEGQPGANGGPSGDLYIVLKVKSHPIFERHENDLHCTVPINVAQAALGTEVDILTFDGLQQVKVSEGTQNGSQVRLKGFGVPHLNSSARGDLYVHIKVSIPEKLSREQRKLFEQLRELLPAENEPQEKGLFDKVKDYFL